MKTSCSSTIPLFTEEFPSSQRGSRARTSPQRGKGRASTATKANSGFKSCESSESANPTFVSLRTFLLSELAGLTPYSKDWKRRATPAGRSWWVLTTSAQRIEGNGSGLWPTATVDGNYNRAGASEHSGDGLATAVKNFPTPWASDWKSGKVSPETADKNSRPLNEAVLSWPTPKQQNCTGPSLHGEGGPDLQTAVRNLWSEEQYQQAMECLNPDWVSQILGYPSDWTDVDFRPVPAKRKSRGKALASAADPPTETTDSAPSETR